MYYESGDESRSKRGLPRQINAILSSSHLTWAEPQPPPSKDGIFQAVLCWALDMVHHDVTASVRAKEWACSSSHGQVVFPKLYERQNFQLNGALELYALPGVLTLPERGTKSFSFVKSIRDWESEARNELFLRPLKYTGPITRSLNVYPKEKLLWKVQELGDHLSIGMGWTRHSQRIGPFYLLENFASALIMEPCFHAEMPIPHTEPGFKLEEPAIGVWKRDESKPEPTGDEVQLYPVAGNHGLRMLALATVFVRHSPVSAVISDDTCLDCLRSECLRRKRPIAIL